MKQVTQRLRDGRIEVVDVPAPELTPDGVLVDVRASLLSAGTERSKVQAGRASLLGKARARPDQARQVIEKARRDGLRETLAAVRMRLDAPSPLGYSAAGVVLAAGDRVRDIAVGDRVAIGGGDHAVHADIDHVPANLCVRLPDGVSFEAAAFATVGAIALHGVRQSEAVVGERVAVIGLGLVGRLAAQLLRAAGCRVVGVDLDRDVVDAAAADVHDGFPVGDLGDTLPAAATGCDAVLITAATPSSDPVSLAARLCRDRGRVVVVGDVGMELPRAPYYDKELELRLSRSYGPGRYDTEYEERGLDYPIGYVRWTERRNMRAFVELVGDGRLDPAALISERLPVEQAGEAYERLVSGAGSPLGLVLTYDESPLPAAPGPPARPGPGTAGVAALVGAGSFARRVLVPGLGAAGFRVAAVASARGLSAAAAAADAGGARAVSVDEALADPDAGLVVIATRHASHAALAERALRSGRAVFVEKPPALNEDELAAVRSARDETGAVLAVGFNRRHAPLARAAREHVAGAGALQMLYRVNAGSLPPDHWLNDLDEGGGRLLGEGCHFVDFCCWMAGEAPVSVRCVAHPGPGEPLGAAQDFTIALGFASGSIAAVLYSAAGATGLGKEYFEVHGGGRSAVLDDFRRLSLRHGSREDRRRDRTADKGHVAQLRHLRGVLAGTEPVEGPDPLDSMAATIAALRDLQGIA